MSIPTGTWTFFQFGPGGAQQGTLIIASLGPTPAANLTIGGKSHPLSVLWDDTAQQITFSTVVVPVTAPFDVYQGWAFQPFPAVPPSVLAGTFWSYSPTGPATAVSQFDWYAVGTKSKETKEKEKDHKDIKDKEKDHKDVKEPLDKLPELQLGSGAADQGTLQMLEQRIARLEQQLASGQSFIKPEERPAVG